MTVKKVEMPEELVDEELDPIETILNAPEVEDEVVDEVEDESELLDIDDEEPEVIAIEDLPDDQVLWPEGPTAGQIKAWKAEHGDKKVYVTSVTYDEHIVWRVIRRQEYNAHVRNMEKLMNSGQLSSADSNLYNEEAIAELCILYPPYVRRSAGAEMAGIPALITQQVMEASGFQALEIRRL